MYTIYVAEHHDQLLDLWREQDARSIEPLRLDFPCDMRGLLIDRTAGQAFRIPGFSARKQRRAIF